MTRWRWQPIPGHEYHWYIIPAAGWRIEVWEQGRPSGFRERWFWSWRGPLYMNQMNQEDCPLPYASAKGAKAAARREWMREHG